MTRFFLISLLLFTGCRYSPEPVRSGSKVIAGGLMVENTAPGNPSGPTVTKVTTRKNFTVLPKTLPPFGDPNHREAAQPDVPVLQSLPEETIVETVTAPAFRDNSVEVTAQAKVENEANRRTQYLAYGLIGVAVLTLVPQVRLFIGGGKYITILASALGTFILLAPNLVKGHETLVITLVVVGGVIAWVIIRSSYHEGRKDEKATTTQ